MKSEKNMISYEISSHSKSWLSRIFIFFVAVDVIRLITGSVSSSGIGLTVGSLFIDGVILMAILKQWKVVLSIGQIVLLIEIVLGVILGVFGIVAIVGDDELNRAGRNSLIASEVALSLGIFRCIILAMLIGQYTTALESGSCD